MKYLIYLVTLLGLIDHCYAQRPLINDTTYKTWTEVADGGISSNGDYVYYALKNKPIGGNTLVIKSFHKDWEKELIDSRNPAFSDNSKSLFTMLKDSLFQTDLATGYHTSISSGCDSYQLVGEGATERLVYRLNDVNHTVVIKNINNGRTDSFKYVKDVIVNKVDQSLVLRIQGGEIKERLLWFSSKSGTTRQIYTGNASFNYIFNNSGTGLAFAVSDVGSNSIWYFDQQMASAKQIATDQSNGIDRNFKIETKYTWSFSTNDIYLFFTLSKKESDTLREDNPIIWNYKDAFLKSRYHGLSKGLHNDENLSRVDLSTGRIKQLLHNAEKVIFNSGSVNDMFVVESSFGDTGETGFIPSAHKNYYLCYAKTGKMVPLDLKCDNMTFSLSPDSKYLLYHLECTKKYYVYDISSKKTSIISNEMADLGIWDDAHRDWKRVSPIIGWFKENNHAILQGQYDLWEIDLSGKVRPFNLTNGVGFKNHTVFTLAEDFPQKTISNKERVLVSGFNLNNKENSLYELNIRSKNLKYLYTAPVLLALPYQQYNYHMFNKAKYARKYLLKIKSAAHSANFIYTKDFKMVYQVSNNYPETNYNWVTSNLALYKDREGKNCEAIIYRPDNFDQHKKYPVIFYYYREASNGLNEYDTPEPSVAGFNLPLLVSNGYIVVKPNIYIERGRPIEVPLNSILAAADYLKRFNWVDSTKMGLMGHSLGGHETNFFVTNTNRFAAAVSAAASSNLIQAYNTIWGGASGGSQQGYTTGVLGFDEGLAQNPGLYVKSSPILHTDKITTPMLLMHNLKDEAVPISQSTQLFVQLRSERKPVWLLQYEGENHTLWDEKNQIDFQHKVMDFFDYYLKGRSIPKWMNSPISYEANY